MTIQEAIKSGKPFRRMNGKISYHISEEVLILSIEDILADDWIVNEEEWYESNFNKKYPNGILCKCKDISGNIVIDRIYNVIFRKLYDKNDERIVFVGEKPGSYYFVCEPIRSQK